MVKKLLKVVVDDIEYEISCSFDYVKHLENELDRYKKIEANIEKRNKAKKQKDITYYEQYINFLLKHDESIEDFDRLYQEVKDAYALRKNMLDDLYKEIKSVKKLSV